MNFFNKILFFCFFANTLLGQRLGESELKFNLGYSSFYKSRAYSVPNYSTYSTIGLNYNIYIDPAIRINFSGNSGAMSGENFRLLPNLNSVSSYFNNLGIGLGYVIFNNSKFRVSFDGILTNQKTYFQCFCNTNIYRTDRIIKASVDMNYKLKNNIFLFGSLEIGAPTSSYYSDSYLYQESKGDFLSQLNVGLGYYFKIKPKDDDKDGVENKYDKCPNTKIGEKVNNDGCAVEQLDDDEDGVLNSFDRCPNTPKGEKVNIEGCSEIQLDSDLDGILNTIDQCPNTPKGEKVDINGCSDSQLDNDGDGVSNLYDKCPEVKGEKTNNGCPIELKQETSEIEKKLTIIANEINFITNKADLLPTSKIVLNQLIKLLIENPNVKILISGHTDDVGSEEFNFILSEKRAQSVLNYLVEKGIEISRITALGFGEKQLKSIDNSEDARSKNRRVEISIVK